MTLAVRYFLITFATLAVLHIISLRLYLYWRYEWLDLPMHVFGGAVVALGLFAFHDLGVTYLKHIISRWWRALFLVMIVALLWELYEFGIGIVVIDKEYVPDIMSDLVAGFLGGLFGYTIGRQLRTLEVL